MSAIAHLIDLYFEAWHEPDATRRLAILDQSWAVDGELIDPFDERPAVGPSEISKSIEKALHERVPPGHHFELMSPIDTHHEVFRYRWALVGEDGHPAREGVDTGRLSPDGRLALVISFLGALPPS